MRSNSLPIGQGVRPAARSEPTPDAPCPRAAQPQTQTDPTARSGEADPGTPATDELAAQIEAVARQAEGLRAACRLSWGDFKAVLAADASAWRGKLDDREAKAADAAAKALAKAGEGVDAVAQVRAVRRWLSDAEKTLAGGTVGGNMTSRRFPHAAPSTNTAVPSLDGRDAGRGFSDVFGVR
jgi:hypothetical protein